MDTHDSRERRAEFPPTAWSAVQRATDETEWRRKLDQLYRLYSEPVYGWLRCVLRREREDARDIVQSFFLYLLENRVTEAWSRESRFRAFLKGTLRNFVRNLDAKEARQKRGGDAVVQPLDESIPAADSAFDEEWIAGVTERALRELHGALLQERDERKAQVLERYLLPLLRNAQPPSRKEVAAALGVKDEDVHHDAATVRLRMRAIVRRIVRDTVASDDDVPAELQWILKGE